MSSGVPSKSFNEKLAEALLRIISAGSIAGGGASAIWQLFQDDSDTFKAIASALIGVGLAYAARLLMPVHEGNKRRLENAGHILDEKLDEITTQAIVAATRFEDKYMLCQAAECQTFKSEGVSHRDGIWIPLLKEVFVPLQLDHHATQPGFRKIHQRRHIYGSKNSGELDIWDFLAKSKDEPTFRQLAVLAWGGYGKTTLLKHIAFLYGKDGTPADAPKLVPILIVLRQYRELLSRDTPPDLSEFITRYHIPNLPDAEHLKVPERWAFKLLKQGRALVMFDGFDEANKNQRPTLAKWLMSQMRRYNKSTFILTSRPKAYREQDFPVPLVLTTPLWVKDFDVKKRRKFVTRWYECQERYANVGRDTPDVRKAAKQSAEDLLEQIESQPSLKDLTKNPLLLNMIVTFHRRFPGSELPKRRVELYREICSLQLSERPKARRLDTLLTNCDAQEVLQQVAYAMMRENLERITRSVLLKRLTQIIQKREEDFTAHDFLEQIVQISELMVKQEDEYEFAHLSFQEYLAATHIAQNKIEDELYDHFQESWWKPTILFYAGQTSPTRIIREAMNRGEVNLAYSCLRETTKRVDAQLAKELEGVTETVVAARYKPLENYLTTGRWREADQETARLMATGVGKEVGQPLNKEDLWNFPCKDLCSIDELWTRYSHGKYGFSVQSRIYTKCGGSMDGRYYKQPFEAFGRKVGWCQSREWQFSMKWKSSGPNGHLPMSVLMAPIYLRAKSRRRFKGMLPFQISEISDEGELFSVLMLRTLECQCYNS